MKTNKAKPQIYTHEGAIAKRINPEQQLRRSVMSCLLWEREFYEDGESIAERIEKLIPLVTPEKVASIAKEARNEMFLRHIPLFIVKEMAAYDSHKEYVSELLEEIIQRPDEITEFLSLYWKDGRKPISNQIRKGLSKAFNKFNEYQFAKYNKDAAIKLRDVMFLVHPKPRDKEQEELFKRLASNTLQVPDTWEVALSLNDGISKKEKWTRLLSENKLGAFALIRNLRNMLQEKVDHYLINESLAKMKPGKILPFRFISAAKYAPMFEPALEALMLKNLATEDKLIGKTILLVDVSGSMTWQISNKSESTRLEASCGLAILLREICDDIIIFTFSNKIVQVPARHGFALRDAIDNSQRHSGTNLGSAVNVICQEHPNYYRLIIITDEQSSDSVPDPYGKAYIVNIASNKNGVGYGKYIHIDGWSESIIRYIQQLESV